MSAKEVLKVLAGSITVYGVMAACSSASRPPVSSALADVNAGGTRLKANYYAGTDGSQQFLGTFHDTQRSEDCSFTTASDGTIRCLPTQGSSPSPVMTSTYTVYYSDAACTTPIVAVSTCGGNVKPKYISVGGPFPGSTSTNGPALYSLGSATSVGTAYQLSYQSKMSPNACNSPFGSLTQTCTAVPSMTADAGMGMSDDAGVALPPFPGPAPAPTWPSIEASSIVYALVEVPPSDFVQAATKTTM